MQYFLFMKGLIQNSEGKLMNSKVLWMCFLKCTTTMAVWPVRDCGRFPIKLQEKLKRVTTLRIPLNPLLAIPHVTWRLFLFLFYIIYLQTKPYNHLLIENLTFSHLVRSCHIKEIHMIYH